jgi:predicted alpha/beta superfamily hydrolase
MTGIFEQVIAQEQNIKADSLWSEFLQEERHIHIAFPDNFKPNADTPYEVIYILDGFSMFMQTSWTFLQGEGFIPKNMIMVGIDNTIKNGMDMRDRDFTPTNTGSVTGGADKFVAFLKSELLPYINKKYQGKSKGNTLYGGSLAVYVLMTQPDRFTPAVGFAIGTRMGSRYL